MTRTTVDGTRSGTSMAGPSAARISHAARPVRIGAGIVGES